MSTTLAIPANVVTDVREGLFCLMGDAAQEINGALIHPERELHPEWFKKDRRRLEDVFALLDLIGWAAGDEARAIEVDLRKHGRPLKEAVDGYLPLLADQEEEADANDARRAEHGKPPRKDEIIASARALREFAVLIAQALKESGG
jgi:hypothetical protein